MISYLAGTLAARGLDSVVVEVGGIGFSVSMASRSIADLPPVGGSVRILTKLHVRDDAFVLYGFTSAREQELFEKLTSVSGVGPKVALSVLSTYSADEVIAAIAAQDAAAVQRVPGVGKKMASRIILELKDSFGSEEGALPLAASPEASAALKGATEALLSMGFTSAEASLALQDAPEAASEALLLQYALKRLGA